MERVDIYNYNTALAFINKLKDLRPKERLLALKKPARLMSVVDVLTRRSLLADENTRLVIKSLLELIHKNDLREVLCDKLVLQTSLLHTLVMSGDTGVITHFLSSLTMEERCHALCVTDWRGDTPLHSAVFSPSDDLLGYMMRALIYPFTDLCEDSSSHGKSYMCCV